LKEEHKVRERELDEEVERLGSKLAKAIVRIETELLPEIERLGERILNARSSGES
jgi:hypothetical protein